MLKKRGFTLVEVMIATTLLSFIMLGVISISNDSMDTKERIIKDDRRRLQLITAISRFEWDFYHIYTPLYFSRKYESPSPEDSSYDNQDTINTRYERNDKFSFANTDGLPVPKILTPDKNTIEFFTSSNRSYQRNSKQSTYGWVKYTLKQMELSEDDRLGELGEFKLIRTFDADNPYSEELGEIDEKKSYEILEYIQKLEFKFWDQKKLKFVDGINDLSSERSKHLIRGLQLIITWKGIPGEEPTEIVKTLIPPWPYFVPEKITKEKKLTEDSFEEPDDDLDGADIPIDDNEEDGEDTNKDENE